MPGKDFDPRSPIDSNLVITTAALYSSHLETSRMFHEIFSHYTVSHQPIPLKNDSSMFHFGNNI